MHPVAHRGLRELYAMTRQLRDHWRALAARLDAGLPEPAQLLRDGSESARELLAELPAVTAERGIHGGRSRRASARSSPASTAQRSTRRWRSTRRCASPCSTSCTS